MKKILLFVLTLISFDAQSGDESLSPWRYSIEVYAVGLAETLGRADSISVAEFNEPTSIQLVQRLYRQNAITKISTDYRFEAIESHGRYFVSSARNKIYLAALIRLAREYGAEYIESNSSYFLNPPYRYETEYKLGLGVGVGWQQYGRDHFVIGGGIYAGRYFSGQRDRLFDIKSIFVRDREKFGYLEIANFGWRF